MPLVRHEVLHIWRSPGSRSLLWLPRADTPAGPLNRVVLMGDTQWLPGHRRHLYTLTRDLHSDPTKTVLLGTEMRDGRVHFPKDTVYLNSHQVPCANGQDYVRVLGRHALPHLYHPVNSKRLFSGTRSAHRALRAPRRPPYCPLAMFVAKCHGTVNWFTSVRTPSYRALRVMDAMVASSLRATAGWAVSASVHFFREILEGGAGIPLAPAVGFANFLRVHIRHLIHPKPTGPSVHTPHAPHCPLALPTDTAVPHHKARAPVCCPPH